MTLDQQLTLAWSLFSGSAVLSVILFFLLMSSHDEHRSTQSSLDAERMDNQELIRKVYRLKAKLYVLTEEEDVDQTLEES